jgi:hypothetical protein
MVRPLLKHEESGGMPGESREIKGFDGFGFRPGARKIINQIN